MVEGEPKLSPSFCSNYDAIKQLVDREGGLMLPEYEKDRLRWAGWLLDLEERLTFTGRRDDDEVMGYFDKTKRAAKFDWIWYGRFNQLLEYKREYHTFTISKHDAKHKKLRRWVIRQREIEKDNKLPRERKEMMVAAGFDFSHCIASRKRKYTSQQEDAWNEMYDMLVNYKEKHGHCKVCFHDAADRKLAVWVNTQRTAHKEGKMAQERQHRLETLGFVWSILV